MASHRGRKSLDDLTPEQRAKAERITAKWHTPEVRQAEERDREALAEERRATGTVAAGTTIEPDDYLAFGSFMAKARAERIRKNLTLADVAARMGVDHPAVSRLETRPFANPTITTILNYVRAIGGRIPWDRVEWKDDEGGQNSESRGK